MSKHRKPLPAWVWMAMPLVIVGTAILADHTADRLGW